MKQLLIFAALPIAACGSLEVPVPQSQIQTQLSLLPRSQSEDHHLEIHGVWEKLAQQVAPLCVEFPSVTGRCTFSLSILDEPFTGPDARSWVDADGDAIVTINENMLSLTQSADEVAFVLAHEMAHAIAGHHSGSQFRSSENGFTISGNQNHRTELEADGLGAILATRAGFDPVLGIQILSRLSTGGRSHPLAETRVNLVSLVAAALAQGETITLN